MPHPSLPSLAPQLLLLHARSLPTVPYLKFPNTLFGNVFAVCKQGAASVGSHVEAIGCQHCEQVAPLKLDTKVEGKLSPRAEGAKGCNWPEGSTLCWGGKSSGWWAIPEGSPPVVQPLRGLPKDVPPSLAALPCRRCPWQVPMWKSRRTDLCSASPLWGPWSVKTNRNSIFPFMMNRPWVAGCDVLVGAQGGLDWGWGVTHPGSGRCPGGRAAGECSWAGPCCTAWGHVLARCPRTHTDLAIRGRGGWLTESQIPHLGLKEIERHYLSELLLDAFSNERRKVGHWLQESIVNILTLSEHLVCARSHARYCEMFVKALGNFKYSFFLWDVWIYLTLMIILWGRKTGHHLHYNEYKEAEPQRGSLPNDGKILVTPQVYRPESSGSNSRACSSIPSSLGKHL